MSTEPRSETASPNDVLVTAGPTAALPNLLAPAPSVTGPRARPPRFGVRPTLLAALLFAQGGVWMTYFTPVIIAIPGKVRQLSPENYTSHLSLILFIATLFGMASGPLVGRMSDRSTSRFGRRRVWLLTAMGIGLVGVVTMAFAPHLVVFTVGATLSQIGLGGTTAVLLALLPEHVAPARRGAVGAAIGVTMAVATFSGVALTGTFAGRGQLPLAFLSVALVGVVGVLVLAKVLGGANSAAPGVARTPLRLGELARAFYISPRKHPDFAWGWWSRFTFYLASAGVITYQFYYLTDHLGIPEARAAAAIVPLGTATQVLAVVVGALLGGPISDRVGRRKPFVAAAAGIALLGLLCLALAPSVALYLAGVGLIGLATGIYNSVDIALMTAVLPDDVKDAGKDLGVMNIANTLPNTLAPAFAPVLLSIGLFAVVDGAEDNYTMLFVGSAVFALVSVLTVLRIRSVR